MSCYWKGVGFDFLNFFRRILNFQNFFILAWCMIIRINVEKSWTPNLNIANLIEDFFLFLHFPTKNLHFYFPISPTKLNNFKLSKQKNQGIEKQQKPKNWAPFWEKEKESSRATETYFSFSSPSKFLCFSFLLANFLQAPTSLVSFFWCYKLQSILGKSPSI